MINPFQSLFKSRFDYLVLFLVSAAFTLSLAFFNTQSEENYFGDIIQPLVSDGNLPASDACPRCNQPQLYSYLSAFCIKISGINQPLIPTLISAISVIIFMLLMIQLIDDFDWRGSVQGYIFALIALNPAIIRIGGMAQPDALCLVFSTWAIYQLRKGNEQYQPRHIVLFCLPAILAALVKPIGILIFVCGMLMIVYNSLFFSNTKSNLKAVAACLIFFFTIIFSIGGYMNRSQATVNEIAEKAAAPTLNWFEHTQVENPGVRSIADALVTFRFHNLLQRPHNIDGAVFPAHRTSLWSQLYGKFWFAHFSQKPSSHEDLSPDTLNVGRIILVLALFPTLLMIWGFLTAFFRALKKMVTRAEFYPIYGEGILIILTMTGIFFLIKNVLQVRTYDEMNVHYLLPLAICFACFAGNRMDELSDKYGKRFQNAAGFLIILLLMAQVQDLFKLIQAQYVLSGI